MPHATATQPKVSPGAAQQRTFALEQTSDITIARAIARAVRTVAGVVDLSPGRAALAATYGSGQRVIGIAVHHPTLDQVVFEIHVVLSEDQGREALSDTTQRTVKRDVEGPGLLVEIASRIREMVYQTLQDVDVVSRDHMSVDVLIDDLR